MNFDNVKCVVKLMYMFKPLNITYERYINKRKICMQNY